MIYTNVYNSAHHTIVWTSTLMYAAAVVQRKRKTLQVARDYEKLEAPFERYDVIYTPAGNDFVMSFHPINYLCLTLL